ncbi:MAG TPA: hypothetical protein VM008_09710 [Phycisphaerae bacterium]|nr:hypothetical protein [Phycisphaerae bacterium]
MQKITPFVRNGKLGFFLNGEEVELVLPDEWQDKVVKKAKSDDAADDGEEQPTPHPKNEAHCRLWWEASPELRRTFGITNEPAGSDRYERRFREYCRRALKGGRGFSAETAELDFENRCESEFAEMTADGRPRHELFGVKNRDPQSPEYVAGLKKYISLQRNSTHAAGEQPLLPTTTTVLGGAAAERVVGSLTPPREPTPNELKAAMDTAEKAARARWTSDKMIRGKFGLLEHADPDGPEYQNALQRFVNLERAWARDNWTAPVR